MGGSAGIRGYYYQVLAALLESVNNDSWVSVRIEPNTRDDKVDIEWLYADFIQAVQVKSSINNFEKGSVINWVSTLVKDAQAAYGIFNLPITYRLVLIGTIDRKADKWISDLHGERLKIDESDILKPYESQLSNVEIKKLNFDFDGLQALSYTSMLEYLSKNGKEAKLENIKALCSELVNELFTFSLKGREMPKTLFLNLINKHLDNDVYGITPVYNRSSMLSLTFYEKGRVAESDHMIGIHLQNMPLLEKLKTDAKQLLSKVKNINLPPATPVEPKKDIVEEDSKVLTDFLMNPVTSKTTNEIPGVSGSNQKIDHLLKGIPPINISANGYVKVRYPEKDITELKELSKDILGINLNDEDFYFGELEKRSFDTVVMFGPPRNIPRGTDKEKEKFYFIEMAHSYLIKYQLLLEYTDYLNTCYPLPIILKNTGTVADEQIQVTLKFPGSAQIVTPEKLQTPFDPLIEEFIKEDNVFNNLIIPARDHGVRGYEGTQKQIPVLNYVPYGSVTYTSEDFIDHLESLFNYEHFLEGDQDIIQYEFDSLNPSRNMAFPTFLLVQTETDMDIEYRITSKHLARPIEGILSWVHPLNAD
jgi:hypothetical protein